MSKDTTEVRTVSTTGGAKGVKIARYDLIPAGPLYEIACLYGVGVLKYDERNFERGYPYSASFGALQRHAWQFWNGEDIDAETGVSHLASVVWNAIALMQFQLTVPQFDDRPQSVELRRPSGEHIAIMRELGERFRAEAAAVAAAPTPEAAQEALADLQERLGPLPLPGAATAPGDPAQAA